MRRKETLIRRFGLEEFRRKRSFDLSGGQKRRVQVAREFMHDMDILFLDEPTIGLDVIMRRTLLDSIREEVRRGLTVVFTTHRHVTGPTVSSNSPYILPPLLEPDWGGFGAGSSSSTVRYFP